MYYTMMGASYGGVESIVNWIATLVMLVITVVVFIVSWKYLKKN